MHLLLCLQIPVFLTLKRGLEVEKGETEMLQRQKLP